MDWTAVQGMLAQELFGNTLQGYLLALGVFAAVYLGLPILKGLVARQLQLLAQRTAFEFDTLVLDLLKRHVGAGVYFFTALYLGTLSLTLPENVDQILHAFFVIVVTFKAVQILQGIAAYGLRRWTARTAQDSPTSASMVRNLTVLARIGLWSGAALFALDNLGVNVTAFVAGLGVGGVAVALAAQAILGDAFSSFAIFLDKPFEVGDFIIVGDLLGTVEHVGFKTTRIRSLGGEQLVFANSDLTTSRIKNYKRMQERRIVFTIGVIYQTGVEQVKAIPRMIEQDVREHRLTRFDRAHFQSFGDFALIFEVVYYVLSADYNTYMDVQQFINVRLVEEFKRAGIEFAYPTQRLYVSQVGEPA